MDQILTIDTSGSFIRVALANTRGLISHKSIPSKQASKKILVLIDEILRDSKFSLRELDCIGIVTGPGSFTGLRVGIGVAQGLSMALQIPLVGVSILELLAKAASKLVADPTNAHMLIRPVMEATGIGCPASAAKALSDVLQIAQESGVIGHD